MPDDNVMGEKIGDVSWEDAFNEASQGKSDNIADEQTIQQPVEKPKNNAVESKPAKKGDVSGAGSLISQDEIDKLMSGVDFSTPSSSGSVLKNKKNVERTEFQNFESNPKRSADIDLKFILDIPLQVTVEIGRTKMLINDLLQLGQGSVIELNKLVGEPFEVLVNDKLIARGEIVVVNERFGIRLTDVISATERVEQLG